MIALVLEQMLLILSHEKQSMRNWLSLIAELALNLSPKTPSALDTCKKPINWHDLVDPLRWAGLSGFLLTDPFSY
jgi:hypothetical protein